jgi:hypothetical protein
MADFVDCVGAEQLWHASLCIHIQPVFTSGTAYGKTRGGRSNQDNAFLLAGCQWLRPNGTVTIRSLLP